MPILDRAAEQLPKRRLLLKKEFLILYGGLFLLLFVWGGIELRDLFMVDRARQFDEWMLLSLRDAENPQYLFGPHWVDEAVRDITALGGPAVLTFMIFDCDHLPAASEIVYIGRSGSDLNCRRAADQSAAERSLSQGSPRYCAGTDGGDIPEHPERTLHALSCGLPDAGLTSHKT